MYAVVQIGSRILRSACGTKRRVPPRFWACTRGAPRAVAAAVAVPARKARRLRSLIVGPSLGRGGAVVSIGPRRDGAGALGDQPIVAWLAMTGEVEHGLLVGAAEVEVAAGHRQLVVEGGAHGDGLSRGRDDRALPDHVAALLAAALGHSHHPRGVLVGASLHHELVVEEPEGVVLGRGRVVHGRVVAEENHLDVLQAHHAVRLRPPPVVADAHAEEAAEGAPHAEAEVAHLEVALLEMLEGPPRLVLRVSGQVHLPVLAHDRPRLVDEDRRVVAVYRPVLDGELGVAETEAEAEPPSLVEERARLRTRHFPLEEAVDLRLILREPAREEGRQGQLGEHDEIAPMGARPMQVLDEPLDDLRPALPARDRPQLGGPDGDHPRHGPSRTPPSRALVNPKNLRVLRRFASPPPRTAGSQLRADNRGERNCDSSSGSRERIAPGGELRGLLLLFGDEDGAFLVEDDLTRDDALLEPRD